MAPADDVCAKVVPLLAADPSQLPRQLATHHGDKALDLAACHSLAVPTQHCLLPSYAAQHRAPCDLIFDEMVASADKLTAQIPLSKVPPPTTTPTSCDGGIISIGISVSGVWLGETVNTECYAVRNHGQLNAAWIESELRDVPEGACKPTVEITADDSVTYQDVVSTMDVALKAGFRSASIAIRNEAAMQFPTAIDETPPTHCAWPAAKNVQAKPMSSGTIPVVGADGLKDAAVVVITREEISIGELHVASVSDAAHGTGVIDQLTRALPKQSPSLPIILQADSATDVAVINRVLLTLSNAGFKNVLFAVKNK